MTRPWANTKDCSKTGRLYNFIELFVRQLNEIVKRDPEAIVLVDVPLLIELNLQYMFHKTLLVHVPQQIQIERVVKRDAISDEEAADRLKAQLPIDEKVGYADFVIHNEKSLKETRKQVEELWQALKKIQKKKGHSG